MFKLVTNIQIEPHVDIHNYIPPSDELSIDYANGMQEKFFNDSDNILTILRRDKSLLRDLLGETGLKTRQDLLVFNNSQDPTIRTNRDKISIVMWSSGTLLIETYQAAELDRNGNVIDDKGDILFMLLEVLKNLGSTAGLIGNDLFLADGSKIVGRRPVYVEPKLSRCMFLNFNVTDDLRELYIPQKYWNRPFGNVDVDINRVLTEFLNTFKKNNPLVYIPMNKYFSGENI
jgi:hypothetical protein